MIKTFEVSMNISIESESIQEHELFNNIEIAISKLLTKEDSLENLTVSLVDCSE